MSLINTAVQRPVLVTMLMAGLAGLGVYGYFQLPRELFPKIEFPMVTVLTTYEGAGPEEVEQLITKELEDEISAVEGIKHLHGTSQQGLSLMMAEFYLETNVDVAAADVRDKVNLVRARLPRAADDPIVQKFDFGAEPILRLAVSAPRSLREVYELTDQRIKDRLSTVPGVAAVTVIGGEEREIHVLTNQQRLRAHGLSITAVAAAVAAANLETPGGHVSQNSREFNIRLRGKFTDLKQIENLPLAVAGGASVYLRDVAEVRDYYKEVRDKARVDGRTCVGITIQKRADGNTVAVDRGVRGQIEQLKGVLPGDYEITVQDEQASWIEGALANVFENMEWGVALTALALFIFLHNLRGTLIISLSMPVSVMSTFLIMYLMGIKLNMMSMMGLAMVIGVLVDNSILVLENITRHLHQGRPRAEAAVSGTNEIAMGVAASTLTNVVIFVPIAFMGGIIGQFFRDLGLTATFSTLCSLLASFTLTPMLAARLLTKESTAPTGSSWLGRFGRRFDAGFGRVRDGYEGALRWCLRHRAGALGIVAAVLAGSLGLGTLIGGEFITRMDQGKFEITVEMPTGTRLEETDAAVARLEAVLQDRQVLPELVSTYASVGQVTGGRIGGSSQAVNLAMISVTLAPKEKRRESTEAIMNRLRPVLARAEAPGAKLKLLAADEGGGQAPIQMEITGDNMEHLQALAAEALAIIGDPARVPGAIDVDSNYRAGQPEVRIVPDREKCREAGVDSAYLSQVVAASFEGLLVNEYREGAFNYDIRVRNDEGSRRRVSDVERLTVMNREGRLIPLPQVAQVTTTTGPSQLFRKDRQSLITISADLSKRSLSEVVGDIRREMAPLLTAYPDCRIFFGGETERMEENFGRLFVALIMAVCLTYMLLACLLESFTQPLMIMVCVPISLIGVMLGLFLMGGRFSIFSIMSIVVLVGLVINNAIIVLDFTKRLRAEGRERTAALVEAGRTRLRPMVMTNLTTIAALIPLSLGLGWAGELQAPMAMVQIGGLVTGGWIGLLIVPVVYTLSEDAGRRLGRWVRRGNTSPVQADHLA